LEGRTITFRGDSCSHEAYTLAMVRNHYFAWLYKFKAINPNTSIKTAYDHQVLEPTNQGDEQLIEMFCGDLDLVEVSVPTQQQTNDNSSTDTEEEDQGTAQQDCWSSNSCWRRARQQMPTRKLRIMNNGF
jgi:hypothetical protein